MADQADYEADVRRIVRETLRELQAVPQVPAVPAVPVVYSESLTQSSFRTDAELMRRVKAKLALEGRSLQDLLTVFLRGWVDGDTSS